jgi:N6-L-threonylcarbamoyladenine synthase
MPKRVFLGIDTSNYTTSFAIVDENGDVLHNIKKLLPVKEGERGLRQSDAVFAHIQNLKLIYEEIKDLEKLDIIAIGYSAYPRDAEGSYMPCFSVGESVAKMLGAISKAPIYNLSHQSGHIRAAIYSSGVAIDDEFIAFHVSGGTTEIVCATREANGFLVDLIGGSVDLHAGQAIDRIGVLMGLKFPCGKEMEALAMQNTKKIPTPKICVKDFSCNLSGLENLATKLYNETEDKSLVSAFVFDFISNTMVKITEKIREEYPSHQIIYGGGVMSNSIIKGCLNKKFENIYFAEPQFSTDNATGVALLAKDIINGKQ